MSECSDRILQALKQADLSYGELATKLFQNPVQL